MNLRTALGLLLLAVVGAGAGAQAPTLVPAALRNVSPAWIAPGSTVELRLDGVSISQATEAVFSDPRIRTLSLRPGANRNQAVARVEVPLELPAGIHAVSLVTPVGATGGVTFAVGMGCDVAEKEPNDDPRSGAPVPLPATFVGRIDRPGDEDCYRFAVEAGDELVFRVTAAPLRSRLQSVLALLDESGRVLAEARGAMGSPDALLSHRFAASGAAVLRVSDDQNSGGGDVFYRVDAGPFRHATHAFPLGTREGEGTVTLFGPNLGEGTAVRVSARSGGWGSTTAVGAVPDGPLLRPVTLAVGREPEAIEQPGDNDRPAAAQLLAAPVTVNGRLSSGSQADTDCYRFRARKGETLVLEVNARRLGSPVDSFLEVLDAGGNRIERAVLRCVGETTTTLRDRDSNEPGLRLVAWNDFYVDDFLYANGEVVRILRLPRGPDEDVICRSHRGQRLGYLETTPVAQAENSRVYKVQVHPAGSRFPPNGMPLIPLYYQNDDGGPLYGKDSRVTFIAPADGEYVARIRDARGSGGEQFGYRLTIRPPAPDFRLFVGTEHPGVPAGSRVPYEVSIDRIDGFSGPVRVRLEGLPTGITATEAEIEGTENSAVLVLQAGPGAVSGAGFRITATAVIEGREVRRELAPAGGRGRVVVLPKADLAVTASHRTLALEPGKELRVSASIVRQNGFAGRVPIEMRNLPHGVAVPDIGLNGVLITESETARSFVLSCQPWVKPQKRWVYCTVRTETESPASTEVAAEPILLEIRGPAAARR